jgi:hypothetical protein
MWWPFSKRKPKEQDEPHSFWKEDFSNCVTADFIPTYSVCQTPDNGNCRFIAIYSGMKLCSHPKHKSFIPADAPPFDPHEGQF